MMRLLEIIEKQGQGDQRMKLNSIEWNHGLATISLIFSILLTEQETKAESVEIERDATPCFKPNGVEATCLGCQSETGVNNKK